MANQYAWAVNSMSCYPEHGGEQDVVFQVAWVCSATDGVNNTATYGSVDVTYKAGEPFTPYDQLTLDQVLGWVYAALGADGILDAQAASDAQLAQMANPATVTPPLPWNTAAPV